MHSRVQECRTCSTHAVDELRECTGRLEFPSFVIAIQVDRCQILSTSQMNFDSIIMPRILLRTYRKEGSFAELIKMFVHDWYGKSQQMKAQLVNP